MRILVIRRNPFDRWTILAIFGAGTFMAWAAGHYTVFDDEAFSCRLYALPLADMIGGLWRGDDPDPPLYYVCQNLWVHVFGVGPLGLRSLSIVFMILGLIFTRAAAEVRYDRPTAIVTLLICALHPAHLFFGFAGRWYSLMFLLVAVLCWITARLESATVRSSRVNVAWACVAAAVCYTNYFGPVVVALIWVGHLLRRRGSIDIQAWCRTAVLAILLFAPWIVPAWQHITSFPDLRGSWQSWIAISGRGLMALLTGNLASVAAWWVWGPMAVFSIVLLSLLVRRRRFVQPIALLVLGCLVAGIASKTIIDKYILIFSGPACMLVAVLTRPAFDKKYHGADRRLSQIMTVALVLGWLGCAINLVTQRNWSSLRWLDPFESVATDLYAQNWHHTYPTAVVSHPSSRYYFARLRADDTGESELQRKAAPPVRLHLRTDPAAWLDAWKLQEHDPGTDAFFAMTPSAVLSRIDELPIVITLQTTGFAVLPDWEALRELLNRDFTCVNEQAWLDDPDAEWKDRLDPQVTHPRHRITVRYWERTSADK